MQLNKLKYYKVKTNMSGGLVIRGLSKKYKVSTLMNDDVDDRQKKQIGGKKTASQKRKNEDVDLEEGEIISSASDVDGESEEGEPQQVSKKIKKAKKKVVKKENVKEESKKKVEAKKNVKTTKKKKSPKVKTVKKNRSINIEHSGEDDDEEDILSEQEGEFDDFIVPDRTQNTKSGRQVGGAFSDDDTEKVSNNENVPKKVTKKKAKISQSAPSTRVGNTKPPTQPDTRGKKQKPKKQLTKYIQDALLPIMQQQKELMSYVTDSKAKNTLRDYHSSEDSGDEGDIEFDLDSDLEDLL